MKTLERLVAPLAYDAFLRQTAGDAHVHVRRDRDDSFDWLFTPDDADALLARDNLRFPTMKVWLNGTHVEPRRFTKAWHDGQRNYTDLLDMDRALSFYDKGATLSLLRLEKLSPSVGAMNAALEQETGFTVNTTAFLTPPGAANISIHYDNEDFFVLQILGSKRWRLWPRAADEPAQGKERGSFVAGDAAISDQRLAADLEVRAGDTLFVPRGMIHEVVTTTRHSLHLTVSINRHRRLDMADAVLTKALGSLAGDPEARRAIPSAVEWQSAGGRNDARQRLQRLLARLAEQVS